MKKYIVETGTVGTEEDTQTALFDTIESALPYIRSKGVYNEPVNGVIEFYDGDFYLYAKKGA